MTSTNCSEWVVRDPIKIPYGHPPRSFTGKIHKVLNTILWNIAYHSALNSVRIWCHRMRGCHIGKGVYIGRYCFLDNMYPEFIYIYDGASINAESMILTHFNPFPVWEGVLNAEVKPVVIGADAIISVRATLLPGVHIGRRAVISTGMTIERDIADYNIVREKHKQETVNLSAIINANDNNLDD